MKLIEIPEHIDKDDTDFMLRLFDNITIYKSGKVIIKFYDDKKIEYC